MRGFFFSELEKAWESVLCCLLPELDEALLFGVAAAPLSFIEELVLSRVVDLSLCQRCLPYKSHDLRRRGLGNADGMRLISTFVGARFVMGRF